MDYTYIDDQYSRRDRTVNVLNRTLIKCNTSQDEFSKLSQKLRLLGFYKSQLLE